MRLLLVSLCCVAGCATTVEIPKVVKVPVPVPCIETLPPSPTVTADAVLAVLPDYDLVLTLALDRKYLQQGYAELRAVATACVK